MPVKSKYYEARFLLIIALVQFINVLDFMMVMPLGPDFASALDIPVQHLGYIGGSYTLAAAITGLIGSLFLDQYDRKKVILVSLVGLSVATFLASFAQGLEHLILARILAGMFGGPLTATSIAMVTDVIPVHRRGAAMGKVMGAFSLASIFGVPFGLELARLFSWQMPFIVLAGLALLVWVLARAYLPARVNEIANEDLKARFNRLSITVHNPLALYSWSYTVAAMLAGFLIIPNIAAHVQYNLGYPRTSLGMLYLVGGIVTFFSVRLAGLLADKFGATIVSVISTVLFIAVILAGFVFYDYAVPVVLIFIGFMVSMSSRNVAGQALSSKVPLPIERAGFMSIQTALLHAASAMGAFIGSMVLVETTDHHLLRMDVLGWIAIAVSLIIPFLFWRTEQLLRRRPAVKPDEALLAVPLPE